MQVGEQIECSHCQPEKGYDSVEKHGLECKCKCHTPPTGWREEFDEKFDNRWATQEEYKSFIAEVEKEARREVLEKVLDEIREAANRFAGPTEPDCTIYNELRALEETIGSSLSDTAGVGDKEK